MKIDKSIITCELPDKKQIQLKCEPQNIRAELSKEIPSIPYDNIVLIDNQDRVFSASTLFYQTRSNNQFRDNYQYRVYDAQQLYKEFRSCLNMKNKNYNDLIEAQKIIKKLQEEIQQKENSHKVQLAQLTQTNSQVNNILQSTQKEMERLTGEKEEQIKELQDKIAFQDHAQRQMASQINKQYDQIQDLETENALLLIKIDQQKLEIEKVNQDKQQTIKQWNIYYENTVINYQQQLQAYTQQYYEQVQALEANKNEEIRIQKEDMDSQIQKINKSLKAEKDKNADYHKTILDNEDKIKNLENQNKMKEAKIEKLNNTITEYQTVQRNTTIQIEQTDNSLNSKDQEIKKLQKDIRILNNQRQQLEEDKFQLTQQIQNQIADIKNKSQQIQDLNTQKEEQSEINQQQAQELHQKSQDCEKLSRDLKNLQSQKSIVDKELQESKRRLQEELQKMNEMDHQGNTKYQELERKKNENQKQEQEIKVLNRNNQELQDKLRESIKARSEKEFENNQLALKLAQTQNALNIKEQEFKDATARYDLFSSEMKKALNTMEREMEQSTQQIAMKDLIIKKITNQKQDDKYYDKINGLMERLIQSPYKIYQFLQDQNVLLDKIECEIYEISIDYDKARDLLRKNQYFQFEDCLIKTDKGSVKINRSIQGNAESTFYKGYLCVVEEASQNEYKGKYLLRKEYISQTQSFNNINDAIQMTKNNWFCQILLEQFNKALQMHHLKCAPQQIAKQFVLKHKEKNEYYYYEMVEEGQFSKVNGGVFQPQQPDEHSYFNAFSKYVYEISKRNYIITYLCLCGNYVYDMIVSTGIKGLFSPLDQGQSEIGQFLDIIDNQPRILIDRHWTPNIQALAEQGFN